jgi:ABC-type bacteriocin/lantibiotic exporter with double-glycine peptidase domain
VRGLEITRLLIAHRPETIASADRVLLLGEGRIESIAASSYRGDAAAHELPPVRLVAAAEERRREGA